MENCCPVMGCNQSKVARSVFKGKSKYFFCNIFAKLSSFLQIYLLLLFLSFYIFISAVLTFKLCFSMLFKFIHISSCFFSHSLVFSITALIVVHTSPFSFTFSSCLLFLFYLLNISFTLFSSLLIPSQIS